jgi:CSLREA domain-containing protein
MRRSRILPLVLPALLLAGCGEEPSPTGPGERPGDVSLSQTAGVRVVNSVADPGDGVCNAAQCTLREAIDAPQTTAITFAPGLVGPITLARPGEGGGRLEIERALTITGPSQRIAIRGQSPDLAFPVIRVANGARVTLANSTIAGNSARNGGGISLVEGSLTVEGSTITRNTATEQGGGVFNRSDNVFRRGGASIRLLNSTVSGNSARFGGGTANSPDNGAAGIGLRNTTVSDNSASQQGGGIYQEGPVNDEDFGSIGLVNSLVAGNRSPTSPDLVNLHAFLDGSFNLIGVGSDSGLSNGVDGNRVGTAAAPLDPGSACWTTMAVPPIRIRCWRGARRSTPARRRTARIPTSVGCRARRVPAAISGATSGGRRIIGHR